MKLYQFDKRIGDKQSIALSVVVHVFAIMLIAGITFRYPIARFFESRATPPAPIHYVTVAPAPRGEAGDGSPRTKPPKKAANPIALLAPIGDSNRASADPAANGALRIGQRIGERLGRSGRHRHRC